MTRISGLLASAGVGALMIAGAGPASAKTVHHRAHAAAAAATSQQAEIDALKAQIQALTARLDQQQATQQQAAVASQQAQQQAAVAATQAEAAQTQAAAAQAAVPSEVKTELASEYPKKQYGWAGDTSISGRMYFNFSNINQKANGVAQPSDGTGFNIKRFYLSVDHTFSPIFSADLTTDISNVVGSTSNGNFNPSATPGLVGRGLYVKKAYLQAKLSPAFIVRLGSADMPWIPYAENQYGYRQIENSLVDRLSYGNSADWGIHVLGDLAGGLLSYQVSVVDGAGYRNVKVTNSVDVEGRVSAQYKGVYAAVGGFSGKRGNDVQNSVTYHTARRFDAMAGYKNKLFNVGGEYFSAKNYNNVTTISQDKADGWSLFGNVNFMPKWSVFGRYDWVRPTKYTNDNLKDHYYNFGIQYEPVKIVDLALVYKRDIADNGLISTSNGTIGGADPTGSLVGGRGTYSEIGLFGQLRW